MKIQEQSVPTSKYDARAQGWRPVKPTCAGETLEVVFGGEKWYKCKSDEPEPSTTEPSTTESENEFAREIEELENKIKAIKDSRTAQAIKNSWDKLWDKVEGAASDASTQLKVLILKQKIDAAARKVTPAGQTMNFVDCTGWNTLGCKSDSIKKVQNCMDIGVSGNFDEFLKSELARYKSTYAFREGFNDSDVQKICAYKQEENRQEALKREQLAKQAQKAAEIQAFERKYPQVFPPATERDEF